MAYEINEAKELVVKAGKELVESGLIARTWGNISARISDTQFVITPSGRAYENLTPDEIVTVNIEDCSYDGDVKPSSEKGVHAEGYRLRPNVNFIIHTHQTNASAISILGENITDLGRYDENAVDLLGTVIPTAKYGLSSTKTLKENVANAIEENPSANTVLMKYHGAVCLGTDYDNAFEIARKLETVTGKYFEEICGEPLRTLSKDEVTKHYHIVSDDKLQTYQKAFHDKSIGAVIYLDAPYTKIMSGYNETMQPYIDDLAQIAGASIRTVESEKARSKKAIAKAIKGRTAVFIQGQGAICVGKNTDEAEAVCMVLEKGCQAAYLSKMKGGVSPVNTAGAHLEREVYVAKYSKLK